MPVHPRHDRAYTLVEIAVVLLIIGLIISMVPPAYVNIVNAKRSDNAAGELEEIAGKITDFYIKNGHYPDSLEEVISPVPLDPWGSPYEYLRIAGATGHGMQRKDKNLVPINSDFDLYSKGPDGQSASPLTANLSKDDIIRGRNGKFFGQAIDY